jgi:hypothetical protein
MLHHCYYSTSQRGTRTTYEDIHHWPTYGGLSPVNEPPPLSPSCSKADTPITASHGDLITCSRTWEGCTLLTRDLQIANAPSASAPTIQLQRFQYPVHVRTPANVRNYSEM